MHNEQQKPIVSHFNAKSTSYDVVRGMDLKGKNVVMTGGYMGTGIHTVRALARAGAHITVVARGTERAKWKLRHLKNVTVEYIDLLLPETIDAFVKKYLASGKPLNILINHAGVMNIPKILDARGYERHFATNHLGHFQLTLGLLPALRKANGARVVTVSSRGHRMGGVIFDDVNFERTPYQPMRAYAQSKSANALFSVELDHLMQKDNIRAFAVHPGPVPSSDLFAESVVGIKSPFRVELIRMSAELMRFFHATEILNFIRQPKDSHDIYKTVQQGAATTTWAATSPDLDGVGGVYCEDCNIAMIVPDDQAIPYGVREYAIDKEMAERLWKMTEQMLRR
jgi:NAD(P)-dependent dehydrogenase (short-subunit alcohol dehydrogenase family)